MTEIKAEDLEQGVYDLFDEYVHGLIDRREFLHHASKYAVAGLTATAIFDFLSPDYTLAQHVGPLDPRLSSEYIEYDSPKGGGTIKGLLSRPANHQEKLPGIVVVHENRGLNPYIEDVARRAGLAGFISLAPDALSPFGGYPGTDDEGRKLQRERDRNGMLDDFIAAHTYLKSHPECSGRVGVVGFCFGGWVSNMMAVRIPELGASVPFYGVQPDDEDVPKIQAPLMIHYAGLDTRVNTGWPNFEAALIENNKEYKVHMYPNANHGFHNDTTPRHDKPAADLAWQRTIVFFNNKLR